MRRRLLCLALASPAVVVGWGLLSRITLASPGEPAPPGDKPGWTTAVEPKPLCARPCKKGLDWLAEHQLPAAAGARARSRPTWAAAAALKDTPNVADTCIAALALIRSGSTPTQGPYKDAIVKAVRFVRSQVEASDAQVAVGLERARARGSSRSSGRTSTRSWPRCSWPRSRAGCRTSESKKGVDVALHKVLDKIERHQKADGTFDGAGWAPILAQAMCGKGINRAGQAGAQVSAGRPRPGRGGCAQRASRSPAEHAGGVGPEGLGGAGVRPGSAAMARSAVACMRRHAAATAGVELYGVAAELGVLQDSVNTLPGREAATCATRPRTPPGRAGARRGQEEARRDRRRWRRSRTTSRRRPSSRGSTTSSSSPASAPTAARSSSAT